MLLSSHSNMFVKTNGNKEFVISNEKLKEVIYRKGSNAKSHINVMKHILGGRVYDTYNTGIKTKWNRNAKINKLTTGPVWHCHRKKHNNNKRCSLERKSRVDKKELKFLTYIKRFCTISKTETKNSSQQKKKLRVK